jgi:hypothetical protein
MSGSKTDLIENITLFFDRCAMMTAVFDEAKLDGGTVMERLAGLEGIDGLDSICTCKGVKVVDGKDINSMAILG